MTITQDFGTYTPDSWKDAYTVLNGRDLASTLNEKIDGILRSRYLQWIHIDEADGLTAGDQERLRKRMEGNSIATFILTCNERDKIQKAIVSRCRVIPFKPLPTQLVAQRLLYISIKEGFCGNPPTQEENNFLLKLAERSRGDLRVIDDLDLYVKDGKLDAEAMKDFES
jgi:DNA polymerase III delta prime subunit